MADTNQKARTIVWGTGNVGYHGLRIALEHPALDVVGLHAHSASKQGKDAGALCDLGHDTGIQATGDVEALLALKPDVAIYMSNDARNPDVAAELARLLEAGIDVVSIALITHINPAGGDPATREALEQACRKGGATLFINGIDPGFSGDLLPLTALSLTDQVELVHVQEIFDYSTYEDPEYTGAAFCFGQGPEAQPVVAMPGAMAHIWGGMLHLIANAVGVELDEVRDSFERCYADRTFDCKMGHIEQGTCSGARFSIEGLVKGKPFVIAEHVTRLGNDQAPEWPQPPEGRSGVHRVIVKGRPDVTLDCFVIGADGDHNTGGVQGTANRVINAIPEVMAHGPGLVTLLDLPYTYSRNPAVG